MSTKQTPIEKLAEKTGKPDIIVDATGSSAQAFGAMQVLGKNGVLAWTSVTGGDAKVEVPADKITLEWVLGNKLCFGSVNANREHFELGIRDFGMAEHHWPGQLEKILTHPVQGLENYQQMMSLLVDNRAQGALKVYVEVAAD